MRTFQQDPGMHMVQYCNERAKNIREAIDERHEKHNIRCIGDYVVHHKGFIASKLINKTAQTIDTNECEKQYWQKKLEGKEDLIDWKARKAISKIRTLAAAIKCYYGINHYSQRDHNINNRTATNECPRCLAKED